MILLKHVSSLPPESRRRHAFDRTNKGLDFVKMSLKVACYAIESTKERKNQLRQPKPKKKERKNQLDQPKS